MAQGMEQDTRA